MQWSNNGVALNLNYDGVANNAKFINVRVANKNYWKNIILLTAATSCWS